MKVQYLTYDGGETFTNVRQYSCSFINRWATGARELMNKSYYWLRYYHR